MLEYVATANSIVVQKDPAITSLEQEYTANPHPIVIIKLLLISFARASSFSTSQFAHTIFPFRNLVFDCDSQTRKFALSSAAE